MKKNIFLLLLLLISFGIFLHKTEQYSLEKENEVKMQTFFETDFNSSNTTSLETKPENNYMGILEIPSLSLKRGFYSFSHPLNTVEKNIQVISSQCFPFEPCSFLLASHSGSSNISYFKHLHHLVIGEKAYLYYKKEKKEYQLNSILHQEKNGSISLQAVSSPQLVLTTCNPTNDSLQDLYLFREVT